MFDDGPARIHLIVSPASGGGEAGRQAPSLVDDLRRRGHDVGSTFTTGLDHAEDLAMEAAAGGAMVVAVGGDGLVTAVTNGVARATRAVSTGPRPTMGIAPFGTANDFARALGITKAHAIDVLVSGRTRPVDLGFAGDRYFTCIASTGFDAAVIECTLRTKLVKGPLVYPYAVLKTLLRWKPESLRIETPERTEAFVGFSIAVANAGVFGGGMRLAPDADLGDGLFDIVIIKGTSRLRFLRYAPMVFRGTHVRSPDVEIWQTDRATIYTGSPFMIYADGEAVAAAPLEFIVRPSAVDIRVPNES